MLKKYAQHAKIGRININMRCIEIDIPGGGSNKGGAD